MNKIIIICLLFLSLTGAIGQSFNGSITYHIKYESKNPQITNDMLNTYMGDTIQYFISGNKYYSEANGMMVQQFLYDGDENKIYQNINGTVSIIDASVPDSLTYQYSELVNSDVTVLGKITRTITVTTEMGKSDYYFIEDVKVDPDLFQHHRFQNWNELIRKTKSITIKYRLEYLDFVINATAVSINVGNFSEIFFEGFKNVMINSR